jgi:CubicO group peptidase (beta-lactamase class C family)
MKHNRVALLILLTLLIRSYASAAEPADIPRAMQAFVDRGLISGSVTLVAKEGKIVSFETVGQADIESRRPMQKDTLFWIASMTKPVTATALMILEDEGKLSVDEPVAKFIAEFKDVRLNDASPARAITIRDLLTHTSGLADPPRVEGANPSLAETVIAIAREPLQFEPGTQWKYGRGLTVVGRIIEVASGKSYADFLAERIFQPLSMNDTGFHPTAEQRGRLATIYRPGKEKGTLEANRPALLADPSAPPRAPNPSGGLFSSASDMFRFYQMVLNGGELDGKRIVSAAAVREMTANHTGDLQAGFGPGQCWGLGWGIVREPIGATDRLSPGTFGHGGGFGTQGWVDPQRRVILVFLSGNNGLSNAAESEVRGTFQRVAMPLVE